MHSRFVSLLAIHLHSWKLIDAFKDTHANKQIPHLPSNRSPGSWWQSESCVNRSESYGSNFQHSHIIIRPLRMCWLQLNLRKPLLLIFLNTEEVTPQSVECIPQHGIIRCDWDKRTYLKHDMALKKKCLKLDVIIIRILNISFKKQWAVWVNERKSFLQLFYIL